MKRKRQETESENRCQSSITNFFKRPLMQGTNDNTEGFSTPGSKRSYSESLSQKSKLQFTSTPVAQEDPCRSSDSPLRVFCTTPNTSMSAANKTEFYTPEEWPSTSSNESGSEFHTGCEKLLESDLVGKDELHSDDAAYSEGEQELSREEEDKLLNDTDNEKDSRSIERLFSDKDNVCSDGQKDSHSCSEETSKGDFSRIALPEIKRKLETCDDDGIGRSDSSPQIGNQFHELMKSDSIPEESESDDDLLTPPSFLYEQKQSIHVATPKKVTKPVDASPLTSPVKPLKQEPDKKYRFTVSKLLHDKSRTQKKNAELVKMEEDLEEAKKLGSQMSESDWDDSEIFDDGRDLSQCKLPDELKAYLGAVNNFSDDIPGEDIFPDLEFSNMVAEIPTLAINNNETVDKFQQLVKNSSPEEIRELICGGWIMQYYLKRPCPAEVGEWLFNVMCTCNDLYISTSCYHALWSLFKAGTQDRNGIPRGVRGVKWVPTVKHIVQMFIKYGASLDSLVYMDPVSIGLSMDSFHTLKTEQRTKESLEDQKEAPKSLAVYAVGQLLQFVSHCLQMAPLNYTVDHLHQLLVILCRLSLDLRLQTLLFDIEMALLSILNCFGESQWEEEVKELAILICQLSCNHHNLLHIVQLLPPSLRGVHLKCLVGHILLHVFTREFQTGCALDKMCKKEAVMNSCKVATLKVSQLVTLVNTIKPQDESDYSLLHTMTALIDVAVGSENLPSTERGDLGKLSKSLQSLNGDIKDPRAAFLDRTKVKDLLVRTITKVNFLIHCIALPKERSLTTYFDTDSSDYFIETLKESTPPPITEGTSGIDGNVSSPSASSPEDASNSDRDEEKMNTSDDEDDNVGS